MKETKRHRSYSVGNRLDHSVDKLANEDLVVTVVTTLVEVEELLAEATIRAVQLEAPPLQRGW